MVRFHILALELIIIQQFKQLLNSQIFIAKNWATLVVELKKLANKYAESTEIIISATATNTSSVNLVGKWLFY